MTKAFPPIQEPDFPLRTPRPRPYSAFRNDPQSLSYLSTVLGRRR